MKIRNGFVSNSSSSSFVVIDKKGLSHVQIDAALNICCILKKLKVERFSYDDFWKPNNTINEISYFEGDDHSGLVDILCSAGIYAEEHSSGD